MPARLSRVPVSRGKYPVVDGVVMMPDGREVCDGTAEGKRAYALRRSLMAERQNNLCAICHGYMDEPTFEHQTARSAGRRDDRIERDGRWLNAASCFPCNMSKGSRAFEWVGSGSERVYIEVEK